MCVCFTLPYHYYIIDFQRRSKEVFGSRFYIHFRASASINRRLTEAVFCPSPKIGQKTPKKKKKPTEPIMGTPSPSAPPPPQTSMWHRSAAIAGSDIPATRSGRLATASVAPTPHHRCLGLPPPRAASVPRTSTCTHPAPCHLHASDLRLHAPLLHAVTPDPVEGRRRLGPVAPSRGAKEGRRGRGRRRQREGTVWKEEGEKENWESQTVRVCYIRKSLK